MAYILLGDRPYNRIIQEAASYLRQRGHDVDTSTNGNQLRILAEKRQPDVLAVSYYLNDLEGFQVVQSVKALYPDSAAQFLWITLVKPDGEPGVSWKEPTFSSYVIEPYSAWQLVLSVEQLIYRHVTPR